MYVQRLSRRPEKRTASPSSNQRGRRILLVVIKGEEEYEVEKILNQKKFRRKDRYLVQ